MAIEQCKPIAWRDGECSICRHVFRRCHPNQQECSRECRVARRGRSMVLPSPRSCIQCGVMFAPKHKRTRLCSRRCAKRRAGRGRPFWKNALRRAKHFGVPRSYSISPAKVFQRDRWRCQLCGVATPRKLRGTEHPRAPELDHIIPLSYPGSPGHVWTNVQCACRQCNIKKGSTPLGQLRLA